MADPNWLLSTTSQSAAAIVAIVGGFLVSRVIGLTAERNALNARRDETQAALDHARSQLDEAEERLLRLDIADFLDLAVKALLEEESYPPIEEMVAKVEYQARSPDELSADYKKVVALVKDARERIRQSWQRLQSFPRDYEDYRGQSGDREDPEDAWGIHQDLFDAEMSTRASERGPFGPFQAIKFDLGSLITPPAMRAMQAQAEIERYRTAERAVEDLRIEVAGLTGQVDLIGQLIERVRLPRSIWWGYGVLVYLAVVGVLVPVTFLPKEASELSQVERYLVIGLFSSGVLAVMGYIGVAIALLRRGSHGRTPP
jgi:hypothetical protein